ncbi:hypothetical protein Hanom_Chr08g00720081 [Helianthus anomalus]
MCLGSKTGVASVNLVFRRTTTIRRVCKSDSAFISILLPRFHRRTESGTNAYKLFFFTITNNPSRHFDLLCNKTANNNKTLTIIIKCHLHQKNNFHTAKPLLNM